MGIKITTAGQLAAILAQVDPDLPVVAGCHYDNDGELTLDCYVDVMHVMPLDGDIHTPAPSNVPLSQYPDAFPAVVIA